MLRIHCILPNHCVGFKLVHRIVHNCIIGIIIAFMTILVGHSQADGGNRSLDNLYVGSDSCKKCHEKEYHNFKAYAKKSRSYGSIERLQKGLSQADLKKCYVCHTTGYGKPGGFLNIEKTPHLKNAGCEVCHGPGELHIRTKDPKAINRKLTTQVCIACHTSERVNAFRYKPLIHGGGH